MIRAAIAASISFAFLAGCGKPVPIGAWRGHRTLEVNAGTDPAVADQLRRVTLRIDEGGKGLLEDGGIPYEGQFRRGGDRLDLEVFAVNGINVAKQPPGVPRALRFDVLPNGAIQYDGTRLERVSGG